MASSPTISDPLRYHMCAALGDALQNWAMVEGELAWVFYAMTECPTWVMAADALEAVVNFNGRIQVVDAAARTARSLDDEHRAMWSSLKNRLTSENKRRNKLAHGVVHVRGDGDEMEAIIIPYGTMAATLRGGFESLTRQDVVEIGQKFLALTGDLSWFSNRLLVRLGQRAGDLAPMPDRIAGSLRRSGATPQGK